jgi:hypothetical protein
MTGLVLAEGVVRITSVLGANSTLLEWQRRTANDVQLTNGRHVRLGEMIRPSRHPEIVYELIPEMDVHFGGKHVVTGSRGFRGEHLVTGRDDDVLCIVALGDSVLFGSGVESEQCFLNVLAHQLRALRPDMQVMAVNTGVPGYNTSMEVATLQHKCLDLAPDIVIIDFVENDFDLPNFLLLPTDALRIDRLFLADIAHRALRRGSRPNGPLEDAPMENSEFFMSDPARVPDRYRSMVGESSYRAALQSLQQLADGHGFRILVSCHTQIDGRARRICEELGLPVVTAAARQRAWLSEREVGLMQSALVVARDDRHPSAIGHRMLADELRLFLVEQSWLDQ